MSKEKNKRMTEKYMIENINELLPEPPRFMPSQEEIDYIGDITQTILNSNVWGKNHTKDIIKMILHKARVLDIDPVQAMNQIGVMEFNGVKRLSPSAELMLSCVLREFPHAIKDAWWSGHYKKNNLAFHISVFRPGMDEPREFVYDWAMVVRAEDYKHNINYQKYPEDMVRSRCISRMCRTLFPDAIGGMSHTPPDLGGAPVNPQKKKRRKRKKDEGEEKKKEKRKENGDERKTVVISHTKPKKEKMIPPEPIQASKKTEKKPKPEPELELDLDLEDEEEIKKKIKKVSGEQPSLGEIPDLDLSASGENEDENETETETKIKEIRNWFSYMVNGDKSPDEDYSVSLYRQLIVTLDSTTDHFSEIENMFDQEVTKKHAISYWQLYDDCVNHVLEMNMMGTINARTLYEEKMSEEIKDLKSILTKFDEVKPKDPYFRETIKEKMHCRESEVDWLIEYWERYLQ